MLVYCALHELLNGTGKLFAAKVATLANALCICSLLTLNTDCRWWGFCVVQTVLHQLEQVVEHQFQVVDPDPTWSLRQ